MDKDILSHVFFTKNSYPKEVYKALGNLLTSCKNNLKVKNYNKETIRKAFFYMYKAHKDRSRKSGAPQWTHCYEVTNLLLKNIHSDDIMVISALLHDIYDAGEEYNYTAIKNEFGSQIAAVVDNVYKIQRIETSKINVTDKMENYRKLLLSLFSDIRVLLVKLADRLHDMLTLDVLPMESQIRLAKETLYIYTPFVNRIGLRDIKWQFEDLSFQILNPKDYNEIYGKLNASKEERDSYIDYLISPIKEKLANDPLLISTKTKFDVYGRSKHIFSIYNKILNRKRTFEELYDIFALRVVLYTDNPYICHYAYGLVASLYPPAEETFKDYICAPKLNGYQSIHTGVVTKEGKVVEVQFRTNDMHFFSEKGVAAHFRYKSNQVGTTSILEEENIQDWLSNVREIFENSENQTFEEMLMSIRRNLFMDEIFLLTPKNDYISLPRESVPLDYAFKIHTDIGSKYIGAKVNSKVVPMDYKLQSGDRVEILTSENTVPQKEWLKYVITPKAISFINKYCNEQDRLAKVKGMNSWNEVAVKHDLKLTDNQMKELASFFNFRNISDMYTAIGKEQVSLTNIVDYVFYRLANFTASRKIAKQVPDILNSSNNNDSKSIVKESINNIKILGRERHGLTNDIIKTIIDLKSGNIISLKIDYSDAIYNCELVIKTFSDNDLTSLIHQLGEIDSITEVLY